MSDSFAQRGGWWVVGQSLLISVIGILGVAGRTTLNLPASFIGGLVLLVISAVCGVAGLLALGPNLSPFPKPSANTQFVQRGIYGLIRHPLYTSVFCAALGWSLVWQGWAALVISLALGVFLDAKARHEERWLRQQFPDYATYAQQVRRFIPWIY
ncbi:MAG TPA: isoprenylcysteine carboxylmethyltransferase family protein [Candidatus Acidoferrales bacterium]|nr:isoprenylcysteine carboxylmethyltransferase family protein [Candidatus Acidoferrales bacterium]